MAFIATITLDQNRLGTDQTAKVNISFNTAITGFSVKNLTSNYGTLSELSTRDNVNWTAVFTPKVNINTDDAIISLSGFSLLDTWGDYYNISGFSNSFSIDTTDVISPSVKITIDKATLTAGQQAKVSIQFSEIISGLTLDDLSSEYGVLSNLVAKDNMNWTATFTPNNNINAKDAVIMLAEGSVLDVAGNANTDAFSSSFGLDTRDITGPSAQITLSKSTLAINQKAKVSVKFSEAVTGFSINDLSSEHGTLSNLSTKNNITWTATFTPNINIKTNSAVISLADEMVLDTSGNLGIGHTSRSFSIDTRDITAPTALVTLDKMSLSSGQKTKVTVKFSEAVTGFSVNDLSSKYGTFSDLTTKNNLTWTTIFTPNVNTNTHTATVYLAESLVVDAAGNLNIASSSHSFSIDTRDAIAPTAQIMLNVSSVNAEETAKVNIQFSEVVSGFTLNDLSCDYGTLSNLKTSNNINWTADFTPYSNVSTKTAVITLADASLADIAGNLNSATFSQSFSIDTKDKLPPNAQISLDKSDLTVDQTAKVSIQFNEEVLGFTVSDLSSDYGTLSDLSTTNSINWTAIFTPNKNMSTYSAFISLADNVVVDVAGNGNLERLSGSFGVHTKDIQAPSAQISIDKNKLTNNQTAKVNIVFSEAITGFKNGDLSSSYGTLSDLLTEDNATWTAIFTPSKNIKTNGAVISLAEGVVKDNSGNGNLEGISSSFKIDTRDTTAPTAQLNIDKGFIGVDQTAKVTIKFSESVSGFTISDLSSKEGSLSSLSTKDNITWTAIFTPKDNLNTNHATISLANSALTDTAGNSNSEVSSYSFAIDTRDTIGPMAGISIDKFEVGIGQTAKVNIKFNEAVTGFTVNDLSSDYGVLSELSLKNDLNWTAIFTPNANTNTTIASIRLANASLKDVVGNTNTGSSSYSFNINTKFDFDFAPTKKTPSPLNEVYNHNNESTITLVGINDLG